MFKFHGHPHCHQPHHHPRDEGSGFGGFRRRPMGFPGARRRPFDQGDLRFVILKLISEKPAHGYEIIKAIEDRLGGAYAPSPGIVYPTLTLLEELGYIAVVQSEGAKKLFDVTEEGRAALDKDRETVEAIFARMAEVQARQGGGPAPEILRAYENLKAALKLRVARGPLTPEQTSRITGLLDDAARAVEGT